jgi:glycosyltransferase involved in cell wall biosynthesis
MTTGSSWAAGSSAIGRESSAGGECAVLGADPLLQSRHLSTPVADPFRRATDPTWARGAEAAAPELSVLVPVLDEADSVSELAARVAAVAESLGLSFEIVFVDDGSRDATAQRVREAHDHDRRVKMVRLRRNFGKAAALCAGFDHCRGRIVVTMDGDLQDDPGEIPRLLEAMQAGDLDLVSGWKRHRHDPVSKRYPSRLFNWVTRTLAQVDLHDFNCGFKAYRREVLEQVSIYGELHRYIPVLASRRGFRVGEIEVRHHARRHGSSKYGWDRLYKGLLDLMTVLFITKYTRRPLHLFGVFGLLFLGLGFAINLYLAIGWFQGESLSNRPLLLFGVLLMVLGFQILTTGLLGEMITFKNFRRTDSYSIKELIE